jgi:hypothetical protein
MTTTSFEPRIRLRIQRVADRAAVTRFRVDRKRW